MNEKEIIKKEATEIMKEYKIYPKKDSALYRYIERVRSISIGRVVYRLMQKLLR